MTLRIRYTGYIHHSTVIMITSVTSPTSPHSGVSLPTSDSSRSSPSVPDDPHYSRDGSDSDFSHVSREGEGDRSGPIWVWSTPVLLSSLYLVLSVLRRTESGNGKGSGEETGDESILRQEERRSRSPRENRNTVEGSTS